MLLSDVGRFQQFCEKACVLPGASESKRSNDNTFNTLHSFRCGSQMRSWLGGVIGIDGDVLLGEVAGPESAGARADAEIDAHVVLALFEVQVRGAFIQ